MFYLIHLLIYTYEFCAYLFIHISADYSRSIGRLNTAQWTSRKYVFNVDGNFHAKDPQDFPQCKSFSNERIKRKDKRKTTEEKLAATKKNKRK